MRGRMGGMYQSGSPFWIVAEHKHVLNQPAKLPCNDPFAPHAFTSTEKLTAFLKARDGGRWDVSLVADKDAILLAVADAQHKGAHTQICLG